MSARGAALTALFALSTLSAAAAAQTRQQLVADAQRERDNVLAYIDAMPDSAMAFMPTPGVRTFAQQIEHIVTTQLEVAAIAIRAGTAAPFSADTSVIFHQKPALRDYAARVYVYAIDALQGATPAQLSRQVSMYGQPMEAAGRVAAYAHEHSVWTLGSTVPYLRLNGVTPPAYKLPL